jgi:hypothetical protein
MGRAAGLGLALASLAGAPLRAQAGDDRPAVDPYTKNDPAAREAVGYVSFGPFLWGDDLTNERVAAALGESFLWVETAHFRLGSTLDACDVPSDRVERKRLEGELTRLAKRLPGLKGKPKELDPWLRLHLFAQRVEDLYADFERAFDLAPGDASAPAGGSGAGPYLGMRDKFGVLLLQKGSTLARYTTSYCGTTWSDAYRYYFSKTDGLLAALAVDAFEPELRNDLTIQYALVFLLSQNLYAGFRGYDGDGPTFWQQGLARWFARPIDERCLLYTAGKGETLRGEEDARWEPKIRARVANGIFPPSEEMIGWQDPGSWEFSRHLILWSRVDFVMRAEPAQRRAFLEALQAPAGPESASPAEVESRRVRAAFEALGYGPDELARFDRDWSAWVLKNYAQR